MTRRAGGRRLMDVSDSLLTPGEEYVTRAPAEGSRLLRAGRGDGGARVVRERVGPVPLSAADLDRIEALSRGATPGPRVTRYRETACDGIYIGPIPASEDGELDWWEATRLVVTDTGAYPPERADAEFIAALDPDTVLALVEAARKGLVCGCVVGTPVVDELVDGVVGYRPATAADTGPAREITGPAAPRPPVRVR